MTQQVTAAPPSRSPARRHVRRLLHGWQLAGCLDTALLLASELVATAVTVTRAMPQAGFPAAWAPIELSLRRAGKADCGGKVVWCEIAVPAGPIVLAGLSRHRGCHDRDSHYWRQQRARL